MAWVILTDDHPPLVGGVSTWVEAVSEGLGEHDEVRVFARARAGLPGHVHPVRGRSFGRWGGWWTWLSARRHIGPDDDVLAVTWQMARPLARFRRGRSLHVVFHGSDLTRPAPGLDRVCAAATHRWTVSAYLQQLLHDRGFDSRVLPAPVRAEAPVALGDAWLYVARATPLKGGDRFVRLCAAAGKRGVLIGDGPALDGWRRLAADLGASIAFLGEQPRHRVRAEMATAERVFLLPRTDADGTGAEGLGLTLLEAHALGVPVVGCDTGGVAEAVGPGLLLPDPDDVPASVAAIRAHDQSGLDWLRAHHGPQRTVAALLGA